MPVGPHWTEPVAEPGVDHVSVAPYGAGRTVGATIENAAGAGAGAGGVVGTGVGAVAGGVVRAAFDPGRMTSPSATVAPATTTLASSSARGRETRIAGTVPS